MKKKRFQKIYIEIINRCNLSCSFCPTSDRPARMMSVDEFAKIAAQVTPFTDYICLHVKGEPLMHPWLGDILAIAHQNGLKVNLTTNALLLPEKHQLLLGETAPRQISLSLHSFDANTMHTRDFRSYLENAIDFARTFTLTSPGYISFRLWNLDGTVNADQRMRNHFIGRMNTHRITVSTAPAMACGINWRFWQMARSFHVVWTTTAIWLWAIFS